jgi:transposase-like protein
MGKGASSEKVVREIHRRTRRRFSAEEKIRIILEGLRGEESSRSCVGAKAWRRICTTAGVRSFWRRERSGCSATRRGRQRHQK